MKQNVWELSFTVSGFSYYLGWGLAVGGSQWAYATYKISGATLTDFQKYYTLVAGTYDGRSITLYVNNTIMVSTSLSGTIVERENDILVGVGMYGYIDELAIYNYALSSDQIYEEFMRGGPHVAPPAAIQRTYSLHLGGFIVTWVSLLNNQPTPHTIHTTPPRSRTPHSLLYIHIHMHIYHTLHTAQSHNNNWTPPSCPT